VRWHGFNPAAERLRTGAVLVLILAALGLAGHEDRADQERPMPNSEVEGQR
jgi:hypothetical protein